MNQHDLVRYKVFTRRALLFGGLQLGMLSVLGGRLYYLQVVEGDRYKMLAEENRISLRLLPPPRGRILDRYGVPLALNQQNYRVVLVSEQTPSVDDTLDALGRIVPIGEEERQRILRDVGRKRRFVPVTVREHLDWSQVATIAVNTPDLAGVSIDVGEVRHYPYGQTLAHVIGYVAMVSEEELTGDPLLELPGFRIGKNGVERTHDLALRGRAGNSYVEVNAHGRVIRELDREDGQPGADVMLSIDLGLQQFVSDRLGEESAVAVVLDATDGAVLAIASTPSFDPNAFNQGLSRAQWADLIGNPRHPLINKAIAGQYPPGSTFKMIVALAALESGIAETHRVWCPGHTTLGNRRFHCWKRGGHGHLTMADAIAQSCDVYFYDIALKVGIDRIAAMARRFGLGAPVGIDLPGEGSGLVPDREWKMAARGQPWHMGETLNAGIGQGYVLSTPLQLAAMTAQLVNGGRPVRPHLTMAVGAAPASAAAPAAPAPGVTEAALQVIRHGMDMVVNGARGTAKESRIADAAMAMGGKTGTSQVRRISKSERDSGVIKNEDKPWEERDHALFVGYAPVDDPRYVVAVVVEHGGSGSKAAAPIARDILVETQRRDPARRAAPVAAVPDDVTDRI